MMSQTGNEEVRPTSDFNCQQRALLWEACRRRRKEFWLDLAKGLLCLLTAVAAAALAIGLSSGSFAGIPGIYYVLFYALLFIGIFFLFNIPLLFWPLALVFLSNARSSRQLALLSIVRTAIETKTPLQNMIRAYASECSSSGFRKKLQRFANVLDQGKSLSQALFAVPGLLRYDTEGIIELGGNDRVVLDCLENEFSESQTLSAIRSSSMIRLTYLFVICCQFCLIVWGVLIGIAPKFLEIFKDFDESLPALTRMFVEMFSPMFLVFVLPGFFFVAVVLAVYIILSTNLVSFRPVFLRRFFRNFDSAKLLRFFSVGLHREANFSRILEVYRRVNPSLYLVRKAMRIDREIEAGRSWIDALKKERVLTGSEACLLETAQRTGNTVNVLNEIALGKERRQIALEDMSGKLFFLPCIYGLGIMVGLFAVAMFLPLVKLIEALS